MKTKKSLASGVLLALLACVPAFVRAETYDYTAEWPMGTGTCAIGKTLSLTMGEYGEQYFKISGITFGSEYTFTAASGDSEVEVEVVYKYTYSDDWDTYIESAGVGYLDDAESANSSTWFIDEISWDEIVEDPYSEIGAKVKPSGYYLHVYADEGAVVTVTASKGIVTPPKAGKLTVGIRGSETATWSLKGQTGTYTNGQTIAIMGQQTVVFSKVSGLTKPADKTVTPLEDGEEIDVTGVYGYTLTIKGSDAKAEYDGEVKTGSFTVVPGDDVALEAPETYTDAKGSYVFQCWSPSKAYDFGDGFSADSPETTIVMPAGALTMTATYLKATEIAYMTMYADPQVFTIDEETTVEPVEGDLLWSTDGKTWYECNRMGAEEAVKVLVKKGSYTVQWKSRSGSWEGPAKTKVTINAGDDYSNIASPAVFTFATVLKPQAVVYANGDITESTAGGTVTMKPVDGRLAASGQSSLTLTAKANTGYVFVGWQFGKEWEAEHELQTSGSATTKFTLSAALVLQYLDAEDFTVHYQGVFRAISDYGKGVPKAIGTIRLNNGDAIEPTYDEAGLEGEAEVRLALDTTASCSFDIPCEAQPTTLKLTGTLPKGLKFDAATGILSGKPTVAGTYPLTLTATDPAGNVCTLKLSLVIYSAFESVVGDWRALLTDGDGIYAGLLEMSVTDRGKVSAKVVTASGTTSCATTATQDGDSAYVRYFKATGNAKSGSYVYLSVGADGENKVKFLSRTWKTTKNVTATNEVSLSGAPYRGDSTLLKDEAFADMFLGKYFTVSLSAKAVEETDGYRTPSELLAPGYLTVTTDKKGTAKVAGKLSDGEKVSASALLLPWSDGKGASALVFVVPSGYKKKGSVALQLDFAAADETPVTVTASIGCWTTPPLLDAIAGHEPDEEDAELFLPGLLSLGASGAVYSKLADLTGYYMSLAVGASQEVPTLEYTYTDAAKQKVYAEANPALEGYELDSESGMLTGGTGGKITVAKSPAPWKQSDGTYNYETSKAGEEITNPGSLTISFKSATGIFSGKFNLYFDYTVPTKYDASGEATAWKQEHKSVSCSYEGVLVNGAAGLASAQYAGKHTYAYETSVGKAATKTYTKKVALPVTWSLGED